MELTIHSLLKRKLSNVTKVLYIFVVGMKYLLEETKYTHDTLLHFTLLCLQGKFALQQPLKIQQKTCFKQVIRRDEAA